MNKTAITREQCMVELFKYYAEEAAVTRPELGTLLGKTVGEMAAFHRDHDKDGKVIGPWPRLNKVRRENRRCQYPEGLPGFEDFHACGRTRTTDPLVCGVHEGKIWTIPECKEIVE